VNGTTAATRREQTYAPVMQEREEEQQSEEPEARPEPEPPDEDWPTTLKGEDDQPDR
jgi:hypothetical protein